MKNIIIFLVSIFTIGFSYSQADIQNIKSGRNKLPKDSLNNGCAQIQNFRLDFLVENDKYYDFRILNISENNGGYIVEADTYIDSFRVEVIILTSKKSYTTRSLKIKQSQKYRLALKRYFEIPVFAGVENTPINDVLLGTHIHSIVTIGNFNYLFTSLNLDGLEYIDSSKTIPLFQKYYDNKTDIQDVVYSFINQITYELKNCNIIDYVDTFQLKRNLKHYSTDFYFNLYVNEQNYYYSPKNIKKFPWKSYNVNPDVFNSVFWFMIKYYYNLPLISESTKGKIESKDIKTELLYTSNDLYTIRVKWKIPEFKDDIVAILSLISKENSFKIVGFNKKGSNM